MQGFVQWGYWYSGRKVSVAEYWRYPNIKHQSSNKSRKSFLEQIISDFFSTKQRILSQTFLIVNLTGRFDTCLNTYCFFCNFNGIQCTKLKGTNSVPLKEENVSDKLTGNVTSLTQPNSKILTSYSIAIDSLRLLNIYSRIFYVHLICLSEFQFEVFEKEQRKFVGELDTLV